MQRFFKGRRKIEVMTKKPKAKNPISCISMYISNKGSSLAKLDEAKTIYYHKGKKHRKKENNKYTLFLKLKKGSFKKKNFYINKNVVR